MSTSTTPAPIGPATVSPAVVPPPVSASTANGSASSPSSSSSSISPRPGVVGSKVRSPTTWHTYTEAEVQAHNHDEHSMWVILHGKVYDVAAFLDDHPGGPEILHQHAGKDATQDFEETFHSDAARAQLKDYVIGGVQGYTGADDAATARGKKKTTTTNSTSSSTTGSKGTNNYTLPVLIALVVLIAAILIAYFTLHQTK